MRRGPVMTTSQLKDIRNSVEWQCSEPTKPVGTARVPTDPLADACTEADAEMMGLSYLNKVAGHAKKPISKFILNTNTGEMIGISRRKGRVKRMRRRIFAWAKIARDGGQKHNQRLTMVTLTYSPENHYQPRDITKFMRHVRRYLGSELLGYAWVAEMQRRGAVHYHVLLSTSHGRRIPFPDKAGWWVHGSTRTERARSAYYLATYTGKEHQKTGYPKGLRSFAVWVSQNLASVAEMAIFRASTLPRWLYDIVIDALKCGAEFPKRCEGGGWWFEGERLTSPWVVYWRFPA